MSDRTCPECGETKDIKRFLNKKRRVEEVCTACREVVRRKLYDYERRLELRSRLAEAEVAAAFCGSRVATQSAYALDLIAAIKKRQARHKHAANKYAEKMEEGTHTEKTLDAYHRQENVVSYYDAVIKYIERDARRGELQPMSFYSSNAQLLNKFGFVCEVPEGEPNLDKPRTYYGPDTGEKDQGEDS